ncbi:peptidase [Elizabethkingia meningoseptica]|uniref:tRNA (5-methylaminomethyl-2-thiouridine)(34)-methyltransferase MnmD n=1 Tax=Elizabethkingia meningoseptica TaxID=238 RepID=UPI000937292F|nr:tRNA (5-methylaminomethyl-2-thiouridine)(34)-methyltransferase MnmD [Elizabethkingia meningoseptica]MDE5487567.1 tRNA (5-methylaminomethyl-2-thiouridine)(34)-methyltransferase MnmD [Elizabethkingia meningoseptica]MVW90605.1 peptidase [Elizabethkingia meningoseptica]OPC35214.1 peptidase [Elizabethkingia meningoseptica]
MPRTLQTTQDGSKTLHVSSLDETYHSHHGALQEAKHVFIKNGINRLKKYEINILELGFGTGLNVLVTLDEYLKTDFCHKINYYSLEKYPLKPEEALSLEYDCFFNESTIKEAFNKIHHTDWEKLENIYREFYLQKIEDDFFNLKNMELPPVDVVYFDCFGARVQPDLWEEPLVKMVAEKMAPGGLFTTYSSKGSLQRILKGLNFEVEKLEGPKGKREMINAWKK